MARLINLSDAGQRDAQVAIQSAPRPGGWRFVSPAGEPVDYTTLIRTPEGHDFEALSARFGGDEVALGEALIAGDPEVDLELAGRKVGAADRVYIKPDGSFLYAARLVQVVYGPDGDERERKEFLDVEATVNEETPLPWSGRLFDIDTVVHRFALSRKLQLRHVNGLTYDFLRQMATTLAEAGKMLLLGSGSKGNRPLVFQRNGSPYRGFLEGRLVGDGFLLVLHLSNLELKRPQAAQ
ncbi:MAG: hypothetical protein CSA66_01680 [Proteobacteria bacterium]|nr:MAG: hypothetical protein CSA66_01680 [Pseudomonadota bacterium]